MNTNNNSIDCCQVKAWLPAGISGELTPDEQLVFDKHVAGCIACQNELAISRQVRKWMHSDLVPSPGPMMQTRFDQMLSTWEDKVFQPTFRQLVEGYAQSLLPLKSRFRVGFILLVLVAGSAVGYWWHDRTTRSNTTRQQVDMAAEEAQKMQRKTMLALLQHSAAAERLQAISMSSEMKKVDAKVIDALFSTLNYDSNLNVRLVALEALTVYVDDPYVRTGLIQSLSHQDSPIIQLALADLMVKLQEKRSIQPLHKLLQKSGTEPLVKSKVEESIKLLY